MQHADPVANRVPDDRLADGVPHSRAYADAHCFADSHTDRLADTVPDTCTDGLSYRTADQSADQLADQGTYEATNQSPNVCAYQRADCSPHRDADLNAHCDTVRHTVRDADRGADR